MNKKLNYCPYCGEPIQNEGARFCWSCGKELPLIGTHSTPSPLLESEVNPISDNSDVKQNRIVNSGSKSYPQTNEGDAPFNTPRSINNWANKYVKFPPHARGGNYLESKDHNYNESPKTEIPSTSRQLWKLEDNSTGKDSDMNLGEVANTKTKSQKEHGNNKSNFIALFVIIIILVICVFQIYESFLTGTYDFMAPSIFGLMIILIALALIIMEIKQNRPEKSSLLSGEEKYEQYKNILFSSLFIYVIVLLIALWSFTSDMDLLQGVTILGFILMTYIIVLILKAMEKFRLALGITIILALYWFLAVMSNLLFGYTTGYSLPDLIGHTATNFIGLTITGIIIGLILRAMKKNNPS